ncbi:MAG: hypothetical protein NE334_06780 [Lentisphaeraceae bacterium]|nr:hypothetical protein [Lentisphaeraceae bacterium]
MEGTTDKLLSNVHNRLKTNALLNRFTKSLIIFSSLFILALITNRVTGLYADIFSPQLALVPVALAFLIALFLPNKTKNIDAAREVDSFAKTDDLFLTQTTLSSAAGDFKQLIGSKADQKAQDLDAARITQLKWQRPTQALCITLLVSILLSLFLPTFDPFGKEEKRAKIEEKKKILNEEKSITEKRLAVLKKQEAIPKDSEEIKAELTEIFKDMKKLPPKEAVKKIRDKRRKIAKSWSDKNNDIQNEKKETQMKSQHFGAMSEEMKKISKNLKQGDTASAQSKLKKLSDQLDELSELSDPVDKEKKAKEIKQQMADMKDALNDSMGADSVKAAIDRAMRQMDESGELSDSALKDAAKSMELSSRELERLQKLMDEMDELQDMMQTAQNAEQYAQQNQANQGDKQQQGESPEYASFEEYQEYFQQQQQQQSEPKDCETCSASGDCQTCEGSGKDKDGKDCQACEGSGKCTECKGSGSQGSGGGKNGSSGSSQQMAGSGSGTGNQGKGGGIPGESDDVDAGFKKEQSKSKNQAGKILMQWKTKGLTENGEVTVEYTEAIKQIQEGVDEAISKEKIPPGYHDVIKKYFSSEAGVSVEEK